MDLPVWQALYTELAARNFVVITVAMDTGGAVDAAQWIEAAAPTHPSLIDVHHRVAELYDWVNVPSIAWIDEEGRIVRPNDPGFAGEYFRGMMEPDFDFAAMVSEHELTQAAEERAATIVERAKRDAESLRADADEYVIQVLESLGTDLERALKEVRNGVARVQQEQQTPAEEEPVLDTPAGG